MLEMLPTLQLLCGQAVLHALYQNGAGAVTDSKLKMGGELEGGRQWGAEAAGE